MKGSQKIIYGIAKFGKIISAFFVVSCFILAIVCIFGIIFARELYLQTLDVSSKVRFDVFLKYFHISRYGELVTILIIGFCMCIAQTLLSFLSLVFFSHLVDVGHPFTTKLGRELRILGIFESIVPFIAYGISLGMEKIMEGYFQESYHFRYSPCLLLPLGLMYIILSYFCDYGAQLLFDLRNKDSY